VTELERGSGRRGVVAAFDEQSGLGVVATHDGIEHAFHCVEIADGSRTIDVGTEVSFDLLGKFGRWEAANIRP
jgi:cold shock CspA family protein